MSPSRYREGESDHRPRWGWHVNLINYIGFIKNLENAGVYRSLKL